MPDIHRSYSGGYSSLVDMWKFCLTNCKAWCVVWAHCNVLWADIHLDGVVARFVWPAESFSKMYVESQLCKLYVTW